MNDLRAYASSPLPIVLALFVLTVGANALFTWLLAVDLAGRHPDRLRRRAAFGLLWPPSRGETTTWFRRGELEDDLWRAIKLRRWLVIAFSLLTLVALIGAVGLVMGRFRAPP